MEERPPPHALGFATAALALLGAAAVLPLDRPPLSLFACPLKAATGWPCLFCGSTHAFHFVVRGQLVDAFAASPLGALLALACAAWVALTCLRIMGLGEQPDLSRLTQLSKLSKWRWAALGLVALNWAFVAARTRGAL